MDDLLADVDLEVGEDFDALADEAFCFGDDLEFCLARPGKTASSNEGLGISRVCGSVEEVFATSFEGPRQLSKAGICAGWTARNLHLQSLFVTGCVKQGRA